MPCEIVFCCGVSANASRIQRFHSGPGKLQAAGRIVAARHEWLVACISIHSCGTDADMRLYAIRYALSVPRAGGVAASVHPLALLCQLLLPKAENCLRKASELHPYKASLPLLLCPQPCHLSSTTVSLPHGNYRGTLSKTISGSRCARLWVGKDYPSNPTSSSWSLKKLGYSVATNQTLGA